MTKILALSDTHLNNGNLPSKVAKLAQEADIVLHAGDFTSQATYDALKDVSKGELWAIQGNSPNPKILDYSKIEIGEKLKEQIARRAFGIKIGLMHDQANNYAYDFSENVAVNIAAALESDQESDIEFVGVDVLVFGHLHEPIITWSLDSRDKRRLLVCPGPGSKNGLYHKCSPYPTAALLDYNGRNISRAKIICTDNLGEKATKILALSDTHLKDGKLPLKVVELAKEADLVLHAGNFKSQAAYDALKAACKGELWAVYGDLDPKNPDGSTALMDWSGKPLEKEVSKRWKDTFSICLANDPCGSNVFSESALMEKAEDKDADLLVFGHINQPIVVWGKKAVYLESGELDERILAKEKSRLLVCPGRSSIAPIYNSSFPSVASLEVIKGEISSVELIRIASINSQEGWRWCNKCQGLFFAPNKEKSICPAGGRHDGSRSSHYLLAVNDPNAAGQANWRWCNKCQGLFFGPYEKYSKCPSGGTHDGVGSGRYTVILNEPKGPGQPNWHSCKKCQGLFFAERDGVCPGGTKTEPQHEFVRGDYRIEWI